MWIILLVVVLAFAALIALRRFGAGRNPDRLRRIDPSAAARHDQQIAQHQQYMQNRNIGGGSGGF
jgi:hypothetical protein